MEGNGKRIKFCKQDHLLVSNRIYSNGHKMSRLIIDTQSMEYKLVDPVTGFIFESGGGVTNLEVLQRKAKKALKKFLGISFTKEKRNVKKPEHPKQ